MIDRHSFHFFQNDSQNDAFVSDFQSDDVDIITDRNLCSQFKNIDYHYVNIFLSSDDSHQSDAELMLNECLYQIKQNQIASAVMMQTLIINMMKKSLNID